MAATAMVTSTHAIAVVHWEHGILQTWFIENLSALIPSGHVVAVTGPSGAGKTTLLRLIMGLEKPDVGKILIEEDALINVVFQEERLCKNLSAYANIALDSKKSKSEIISAMETLGAHQMIEIKL